MNAKYVFLNGAYLPSEEGKISVLTHGFSYGTGCFEGIRGYWNTDHKQIYLFRIREHFERMLKSCKILNIKLPYSSDELTNIAVTLVQKNQQAEDIYVKPVAYKADETIGVKLHGLQDAFTMMAIPLGDYIDTKGLNCGVSSWRRVDDNMIPARAKVLGAYVNSAFAKTEAIQNGFDEAIMLTSEGHVSEGSAENIFLVINGELVTPSPSENILQGITRDSIIKIAQRELGMVTRERQIDRTELYTADECFLTGTGAQIAPVVSVDHRTIGDGKIGIVSSQIQQLYSEIVHGKREDYMHWCTPVNTHDPKGAGVSTAESKVAHSQP